MTKQLCVCPQLSSTSSWLGAGNVLHVLCAAKSTQASLDLCMLSPGRRMMASLSIYQTRSPAEGLQPSQGSKFAHRMGDPYRQCLVKVKVCACVCVYWSFIVPVVMTVLRWIAWSS